MKSRTESILIQFTSTPCFIYIYLRARDNTSTFPSTTKAGRIWGRYHRWECRALLVCEHMPGRPFLSHFVCVWGVVWKSDGVPKVQSWWASQGAQRASTAASSPWLWKWGFVGEPRWHFSGKTKDSGVSCQASVGSEGGFSQRVREAIFSNEIKIF